ncbi:hypothetical protein R1sor_003223 [Riccia sorocarpa]|uniref:Uncharacterized protein n=1 Tax=Riccia sorocarpa TaxID=122646 RepID=A0ABD3H352_9MARC
MAESSMESEGGESNDKIEMPLITKSNVGLFVDDEHLLERLNDFSEYVGGRKVPMRETLKSGKVRVGVDVKDEAMLAAMPGAAKIWLGVTKSIGKGSRQEFSKAFAKLLFAHVYLPNDVCFKNKELDPFPGRWSAQSSQKGKIKKVEPKEPSSRKRYVAREPGPDIVDGEGIGGSYQIPKVTKAVAALSCRGPAVG